MTATLQMSMFPTLVGHTHIAEPRTFALGVGITRCDHCWNDSEIEALGEVTLWLSSYAWNRLSEDEQALWTNDGYQFRRTVTLWGHSCCETVCYSCNGVTGDRCSNCDYCTECCDCAWCERCEETVSEVCALNHCRRCCEHFECDHCGAHVDGDDFCGNCDRCEHHCECFYCEGCEEMCSSSSYGADGRCSDCTDDEGDDDSDEDVQTVSRYVPGSTSGRYTFGVELECNIGRRLAASALTRSGLPCRNLDYTHGQIDRWKAVSDSSVNGNEIVSPILRGEDGFNQLETAITALLANGASVNNTCGTHVHIADDWMAGDIANIVDMYRLNQSLINELVSPRRRDGNWCHTNTEHDSATMRRLQENYSGSKAQKAAMSAVDRYKSVNVDAWRKYGTLEFRQHQGTLNYVKLSAWIRFLMALCTFATQNAPMRFVSLETLLNQLTHTGLSDSDRNYLLARSRTLSGNNEDSENEG